MKELSIYNVIRTFNRSDFRRRSIPQELVSGWPALCRMGKTLCLTIPYYSRVHSNGRTILYPLYCSATIPVGNTDRLVDFTIYPYQKDWADVDYTKPAGYFKHAALKDVETKEDYRILCNQLYGYYDQMALAILEKKPFNGEKEMTALFSKLMEPGHYTQYLRINKKFYSYFCRL